MILFRKSLMFLFLLLALECSRNTVAKNENAIKGFEKSFKVGDPSYVTSTDGLYLRSAADISAKKVGLIPFGAKLQILQTNTGQIEVNGKSGSWVKVEWQKKSGYVFDYYLTNEISQLLVHKRFSLGSRCTGLTYSEYSWRILFLPNFKYRSEHISGYGALCNFEHIADGSYKFIAGKITLRAEKVSDKIVGSKACSKMVLRKEEIQWNSRYNGGVFFLTSCESKPAIAERYDSQDTFILMSNAP